MILSVEPPILLYIFLLLYFYVGFVVSHIPGCRCVPWRSYSVANTLYSRVVNAYFYQTNHPIQNRIKFIQVKMRIPYETAPNLSFRYSDAIRWIMVRTRYEHR